MSRIGGGAAGTGNASTARPLAEPSRWQSGTGVFKGRSVTGTSLNARVVGSRQESRSSMDWTARVAYTGRCLASRNNTMPSVWSISASVTRTPSIGTCRIVKGVSSVRTQRNCSRTSGEAFRRNHRHPSTLMAAEDCVRGWAPEGSERATRQQGHQQFHWGKPPPAALPSRRTCMSARGGAHCEPRRRQPTWWPRRRSLPSSRRRR